MGRGKDIDSVDAPSIPLALGVNRDEHLVAAPGEERFVDPCRGNRPDPVDRTRLVGAVNNLRRAVGAVAEGAQLDEVVVLQPPPDLVFVGRVVIN